MQILHLNVEASKRLYEAHKDVVQPNLCYNNIFHIMVAMPNLFRSGQWKVAYGYVGATEQICCRHAFVWSESEGVIDPTEFAKNPIKVTRPYYITKTFTPEEYVLAIGEENGYPALQEYLRQEDMAAQKWALANGLFFIG